MKIYNFEDVLEKIVNKELKQKITIEENMAKYLLEQWLDVENKEEILL